MHPSTKYLYVSNRNVRYFSICGRFPLHVPNSAVSKLCGGTRCSFNMIGRRLFATDICNVNQSRHLQATYNFLEFYRSSPVPKDQMEKSLDSACSVLKRAGFRSETKCFNCFVYARDFGEQYIEGVKVGYFGLQR